MKILISAKFSYASEENPASMKIFSSRSKRHFPIFIVIFTSFSELMTGWKVTLKNIEKSLGSSEKFPSIRKEFSAAGKRAFLANFLFVYFPFSGAYEKNKQIIFGKKN